jgi:hypothetical protein
MRVSLCYLVLPDLLRNKHPVDLRNLLVAQKIVAVKHLKLTTLFGHTPFSSEMPSGPE